VALLTDEQVDVAAATMKLLADPTRLRIVWALLHGEHSVNELAAHVAANPPAVSQHLAKLRLTRLVRSRREGNRIFYSVENAHLASLVEEALFHADHVVQGLPDHARSKAGPKTQGRKRA
jgi:DNA-binding transcriptional ArsR family regulator